jgi:hypothetical protein
MGPAFARNSSSFSSIELAGVTPAGEPEARELPAVEPDERPVSPADGVGDWSGRAFQIGFHLISSTRQPSS